MLVFCSSTVSWDPLVIIAPELHQTWHSSEILTALTSPRMAASGKSSKNDLTFQANVNRTNFLPGILAQKSQAVAQTLFFLYSDYIHIFQIYIFTSSMKYLVAQFHPLPQPSYCWMTEWLIASRRAWSVATPWKETELRSFWSTIRCEPPVFWRLHTAYFSQYSFIYTDEWLVVNLWQKSGTCFIWFGHLLAGMFRFWAQSHRSLLCLLWILPVMLEKKHVFFERNMMNNLEIIF